MPGYPPGPDDLCTIGDLKAWLNDQSNAADQLLQNLITRASLMFLKLMGRDHIYVQQYTENRDGNDSLKMVVRNRPIVSVQSITVNNQAIAAAADQVNAGYVFNDHCIMLRGGSNAFAGWGTFNQGFLYRFFKGFQNVQLVYTAGYNSLDGTKTAAGALPVPGDLQQAALEACAWIFKRDRDKLIVNSESAAGQITTSYAKDLPKLISAVFENYKRRAPIS